MKNVLCLAVGQTYEMVIQNQVTAHPAVAPYPRIEPKYVAPIRKGGIIEYLYQVKEIIECLPEKIYNYKDTLCEQDYLSLISYHENRRDTFGYGRSNTNYRFYILSSLEH